MCRAFPMPSVRVDPRGCDLVDRRGLPVNTARVCMVQGIFFYVFAPSSRKLTSHACTVQGISFHGVMLPAIALPTHSVALPAIALSTHSVALRAIASPIRGMSLCAIASLTKSVMLLAIASPRRGMSSVRLPRRHLPGQDQDRHYNRLRQQHNADTPLPRPHDSFALFCIFARMRTHCYRSRSRRQKPPFSMHAGTPTRTANVSPPWCVIRTLCGENPALFGDDRASDQERRTSARRGSDSRLERRPFISD
jgi:hypothetical protein